MPIDAKLLLSSKLGGAIGVVRDWQLARFGHSDIETKNYVYEAVEKTIQKVQQIQTEKSQLGKKLEATRREIKDSQKHASNPSNKLSNREAIAMMKAQLEALQIQFENQVALFGNIVDETLYHTPQNFEKSNQNHDDKVHYVEELRNDFVDPFFCIGGYKKLIIHTSNEKKEERATLSGIGSALSRALMSYARSLFVNQETNTSTQTVECSKINYEVIHLPITTPIVQSIAQNIFGRPRMLQQDDTNDSLLGKMRQDSSGQYDNDLIEAPPYITLCMLHGNKRYSDKNLPIRYFSLSTNVIDDQNSQQQSTKAKAKHRETKYVHPTEQIELFSLSTCNLAASRVIQDEMVTSIYQFYASLLPKDSNDVSSKTHLSFLQADCQILRVVCTPPSKLNLNEARRVVIQGYLPIKKMYVTLGHVSNTTDYISRTFNIKCGGGCSEATEYVHIIHGILYNIGLLEFIVENNIVITEKNYGMLVPSALTTYMDIESNQKDIYKYMKDEKEMIYLPFIYKLSRGKGGKMAVEDIPNRTKKLHFNHQHRKWKSGSNALLPTQDRSNCDTLKRLNNVSGETICNPYSFLPLNT